MSRKWILIVPIFVVTFLLFQNWILFKAFEWSISQSVLEVYHEKLTWDSIEHQGASLVIYHPKVAGEGSTPFEAEKLTLNWDLTLLSPKLTCHVLLEGPSIDLEKSRLDFSAPLQKSGFAWLAFDGSLKVDKGLLKHSQGTSSFDLNYKKDNGHRLKLSFDDSLELSFSHADKEGEARVKARSFNLSLLEELKASFFPFLYEGKLSSGVLNGSLAFHLSPHIAPQVEGNFKFYDLALEDPLKGLLFIAKVIECDLSPSSPLPVSQDLPWLPSLLGKIVIHKGEKFTWGVNPDRRFRMESFHTSFHFGDNHLMAFESLGNEVYESKNLPYDIKGNVDLSDLKAIRLEFDYHGDQKLADTPSLQLIGTGLGGDGGLIRFDVKNFGIHQFTLIENISRKLAPDLKPLVFQKGKVDAKVELEFSRKELSKATLKEIQLRNVVCASDEWGCDFGAQTVAGLMSIDFKALNPTETLDGELLVVNGFLTLKTLSEKLWNFSGIETKVAIRQGVLQKSLATASLAGLSGKVEIDWLSKKEPLKMTFTGTGANLAPFMPQVVKSGIERRSLKDEITLTLDMVPGLGRMRFKGALNLKDPEQGLLNRVDYGFDLVPPGNRSDFPFKEFVYWFKEAPESLPDMLSPFGSGIAEALITLKQSEIGVFGYKLSGGWFESQGLSLEKYLSSYIFKKDDIVLKGSMDLKGSFDLKGVKIAYTASDLLLESGKLRMEMKEIPGKSSGRLLASHSIDFISGEHRGEMPIQEANYYDKVKGLFFDRMQGQALFHEKKIFLEGLESFLNGVYFKGRLLVDNTDEREGFFDLYAHVDEMDGSLEALSRSLERVDPDHMLLKVPLKGRFWLNEKGADLTLKVIQDEFYRDDYLWDLKIAGSIVDGLLAMPFIKSEATGVGLNFEYDKGKELFSLSDFGGSFLVGKTGHEKEIGFLLDEFTLKSSCEHAGSFDFKLYDKEGDFLSLKGDFVPDAEGKVVFQFDEEGSSVLGAPFKMAELEMEGFSRLVKTEFDFGLDMKTLASRLNFLHPGIERYTGTLSGAFKTSLSYNEADSRLYFVMNGDKFSFLGHPFEKALLEGQFLDGVFSVHNGVFDDYVFSVDLSRDDSQWVLKHLGIKIKEALFLGAEGILEEGSDRFKADLNFAEIALDELDGFDEMKTFVEEFTPKGRLKGTGEIWIDLNADELKVASKLKTRSKGVELKGIKFKDLEPTDLVIELGKGAELSGVKTALFDPATEESLLDFDIEKIKIDFDSEVTAIEGLKYSAPAKSLPTLAAQLEKVFPDIVTPFVRESLSKLKSEGYSAGTMQLKMGDTETTFKATLEDGKWHFLDRDSELKHFSLEFDTEEVKLSTQYLVEGKPVWVLARAPRPDFSTGVALIAESGRDEEPITLRWTNLGEEGLVIRSVKGSALGFNFDLKADPEKPTTAITHRLTGEIKVDFSRASDFLSSELKERIKTLGLSSGWALKGRFELGKDESSHPYLFEGDLYGTDFTLYDWRFDKLFSHIAAAEEGIKLSEFVVEDPFGTFYIKEGDIAPNSEGIWCVDIPLIAGYDLKPCFLHEKGKPRPKELKPLSVKEFQVQDLKGSIEDLSDLTGKGVLSFVNPRKKNLVNTIFSLPSEIISRIGVDMVALTPVKGSVMFDIRDEKVWFTKFKDVVSEGKLSRFYLADNKIPSYMDFSGNLHMQIKMKQYTLLLKLAELLTFNIEGTLMKPNYSLYKGDKR